MFGYLRQKLKPKLPEDVKYDLAKAVQTIVNSGIPIKEIRLFGSLDKGRWNEERSDIDLAVITETNDQRYSCFNRIVVGHTLDEEGYGVIPVFGETPDRKQLRNLVRNNPGLVFGNRYSLQVVTPEDLEKLKKGRAFWSDPKFGRELERGRLLYSQLDGI